MNSIPASYLKTLPIFPRTLIKYQLASNISISQLVNLTSKGIDKQKLENCLDQTELEFIKKYLKETKPQEYLFDPGVSRLIAKNRLLFHLKPKKLIEMSVRKKFAHPQTIVFGYPKCATTWFYTLIRQVTWFDVPPKEIEFFGSWRYSNGETWYQNHFSSKKPSIDVSVGSVRHPEIWDRIKSYEVKHENKVKKLIFVRRPSERALSFIRHRKAKGEGYYNFPSYLKSGYVKSMFINTSDYKTDLEKLTSVFPTQDFFIVFQEDIISDPKATFAAIIAFMLDNNANTQKISSMVRALDFARIENQSTQIRMFPLLKFAYEQEYWWKNKYFPQIEYIGYSIRRVAVLLCYTNKTAQRTGYKSFILNHPRVKQLDRMYDQLKTWLDGKGIAHS